MNDYIERLINFCKNEPLWALAFFFCGFFIGDTYFNL